MALSTVRLHPTMSYDQLVSSLNQNFALVENLNVTQTFKDEKGTPRIILGRLPDGTYGLIISKPGINVLRLFS